MNEELRAVDGRTELRIERPLRHRPDKVWRAITQPVHLAAWFPFAVEIDLRVDGEMRFLEKGAGRPAQEGSVTTGRVLEADQPRVFAFTWGDDVLHFELRPHGDGCVLVFTHTFGDRFGAASFTAGWQVCFDHLEADLDGRPPIDSGDMAELHDSYVEAFGLDAGTVVERGGGWEVRFERQLTRPLDTVWATLTGGDDPVVGDPPPIASTADAFRAGPVTAVMARNRIDYDWQIDGRRAGRVRWELGEGTGQGPRLVVTQTGPAEHAELQSVALDAWRTSINALAARLRNVAP